ncbi:hypothetical protein HanRHA438_Chr05g0227351 [Helianthus annuus]|nr:hypothetical protein HanRHA438_Chr05g0227351 [Helianthus annuus]
MKFPLQCFSKIITGTTGLLAAPDSVQGGLGVVTIIPSYKNLLCHVHSNQFLNLFKMSQLNCIYQCKLTYFPKKIKCRYYA